MMFAAGLTSRGCCNSRPRVERDLSSKRARERTSTPVVRGADLIGQSSRSFRGLTKECFSWDAGVPRLLARTTIGGLTIGERYSAEEGAAQEAPSSFLSEKGMCSESANCCRIVTMTRHTIQL